MSKLLSAVINWLNHLGKTWIAPDVYLQSGGRDEIVYVKGGHRIYINSELQNGNIERIIYTTSIRNWQPPFENDPITEAEKTLILQTLCGYYDKCGIRYKVD